MSLYHGAKTKVRVGSELSEEFSVQVGVHQRSVLSPLLFAIAVNEELINEILYADDLVLMSRSIKNLKEKFFNWKESFESKGLKMNLKKTKVRVGGLKGKVLKSKVDPRVRCDKTVMAYSVTCTKCSKRVQGRCAKNEEGDFNSGKKDLFLNYVLIQKEEL